MRILVIGSGGREHALAWAISKSARCETLIVAPGNAGTGRIAQNAAIDITDHAAVVGLAQAERIDLVVIGPDAPAVAGLADDVRAAGLICFGPSKAAAQLEGSKSFTKTLCSEAGVPTAKYAAFDDREAALDYVRAQGAPIVVKADGLAAGKGVKICTTLLEAEDAVLDCFSGAFGPSGSRVVLEELLVGEEASVFALCDGRNVVMLPSAQDHKRVWDGDRGPNTGGMGAYSPAPVLTPALEAEVMETIIRPTLDGMRQRGTPFTGILYAGLMLTAEGPKLIEYNVRFGDPEAQVILPRMRTDIVAAMIAAVDGVLDEVEISWSDFAALAVVMAAKGYPGAVEKGSVIRGVEAAIGSDLLAVFHAGTALRGADLVANGGRVLAVTALAPTIREAQAKAYEAVRRIDWPDGFYRTDIGWQAVAREA
jgi:phosphoribosylamine---glycine ligase